MPRSRHPRKRRCSARSKRSGQRCRNWAVNGKGVCRMHGARAGRKPTALGLYSRAVASDLMALVGKLRDDPRTYSLDGQLAYAVALHERAAHILAEIEKELVSSVAAGTIDDKREAELVRLMLSTHEHLSRLLERSSTLVERRHRILHGLSVRVSHATIDHVLRTVNGVIRENCNEYERIISILGERLRKIPLPLEEGVAR